MIQLPFGLPEIHPVYLAVIGVLLCLIVLCFLLLVMRGAELGIRRLSLDYWKEANAKSLDALSKAQDERLNEQVRVVGLEADMNEIKAQIWGEPVLDKELHHILDWIDEARASTFYHQHRAERFRIQSQMNLGLLHSTYLANGELHDKCDDAIGKLLAKEQEHQALLKFIPRKVANDWKQRKAVKA